MEPLDLTAQPPRPPREAVDGILFLARNIDKARAALPGGKLGEYFLQREDIPTLSGLFFRRFGCTQDAFVATVAAAPDDAAVARWLRATVAPERVSAWNERLMGIYMRDVDARTRTAAGPALVNADDDDLLIDVLDGDDHRTFSRGSF